MQISEKRFEIETWYQLHTNRKWPIADRMMTSSITSRDRERSRSWSQYISCPLFRKRLEIETPLQRGTISLPTLYKSCKKFTWRILCTLWAPSSYMHVIDGKCKWLHRPFLSCDFSLNIYVHSFILSNRKTNKNINKVIVNLGLQWNLSFRSNFIFLQTLC